jgi:hypothetical protein
VAPAVSGDTILTLDDLLRQARAGELIGVAFVALYKQREYVASATGEARRNPTFTRGMLAALDDAMAEMVSR